MAYGNLRLYEASGRPEHLDHPRTWVQHHADAMVDRTPHGSDEMSPASIASMVALADPSFSPDPYVDTADAYLAAVPRLAGDHGVVHWYGHFLFDDDQVWVDSQFMVGMYWLAEFDRLGRSERLDLAVGEYLAVADLCRDDGADLYRHAYDRSDDVNIPAEPVFWARGNAWSLVFGAEVLARLQPDDPRTPEIADLVTRHADALLDAQRDDGLWQTVLTGFEADPANYTETSASALIGSALVRLYGRLPSDPIRARIADALPPLVDAIADRIDRDDDGVHLEGTSFGTNPGDYAYYTSPSTGPTTSCPRRTAPSIAVPRRRPTASRGDRAANRPGRPARPDRRLGLHRSRLALEAPSRSPP